MAADRRIPRAALVGVLGAAGLIGFYITVVWLGSRSWAHAVDLLWSDRYYVAAVALGFGTQIGLYGYVRGLLRGAPGARASTGVAAPGPGAQAACMIARGVPHC